MRTFSFLPLLALAACGPAQTDAPPGGGFTQDVKEADKLNCAQGATAPLKRECVYEQTQSPDGPVLTLRFPNGAFHRLLITKDGRGVVAADGAEPAKVSVVGDGKIAVAIGNDRYELPATVKGGPPAAR